MRKEFYTLAKMKKENDLLYHDNGTNKKQLERDARRNKMKQDRKATVSGYYAGINILITFVSLFTYYFLH